MPVTLSWKTHLRVSRAHWLAGWLLAAISCASLPPVPGAGGPRWLQLSARHSVLWTDQPEPAARKASAWIERQHAGLCQVAFQCDDEPRQRLRVIALPNAGQFEQLYGADAPGAFRAEILYEPLLVLATGLSQASTAQLSRALTGLVAQQMLGPLPEWLSSGLMSYFETAHFDAGAAFVIGEPVPRHTELLAAARPLAMQALLTQPPPAAADPRFAASAWLLVHYLQSERRADFAAFLASLASDQPLAAAFHEAFPELAPELLDGLLDRYLRAGNYLTQSRRVPRQPSAALVSPLSDADVYSLRAEVAAACVSCPSSRERSALQLTQALRKDPKHVRATLLSAQQREAPGLVVAHPESWLAWVHTAYTEPARACTPELRDHLSAIAPDNAHTLSIAATCALQAGQTERALSLSRRALRVYPLSARIAQAHARILHAAGACSELAKLQDSTYGVDLASPEQASVLALGACVAP